ncbi:hypothetical protein [Bradyrhizobium sp.]|uniref:hypothetical protein n=1 Tax=Bradyrhizobium sp. TaxID=376 RepID=UPI002D194F81|nr:hypothetical protein [Bradyrhizobium sp.]HWX57538.1 hypothetical protein [Bradyrhizobium sp.]
MADLHEPIGDGRKMSVENAVAQEMINASQAVGDPIQNGQSIFFFSGRARIHGCQSVSLFSGRRNGFRNPNHFPSIVSPVYLWNAPTTTIDVADAL